MHTTMYYMITIIIIILFTTTNNNNITNAMEMDEAKEDLPTKMQKPHVLCGTKYTWQCNSYNCLRKYFRYSTMKHKDTKYGIKLFPDPTPVYRDNTYLKTFKTVDFIKCNTPYTLGTNFPMLRQTYPRDGNMVFNWNKESTCGKDTKYFAFITTELGSILPCDVDKYARIFIKSNVALTDNIFINQTTNTNNNHINGNGEEEERFSYIPTNRSKHMDPPLNYSAFVAKHKFKPFNILKDNFDDFRNIYNMCYNMKGTYIAIIGFCSENSTGLLVHIIFMILSINFLYLGFSLNGYENKINIRRCLHLVAAIFGGIAIISGWTAPEITKEKLTYVGLYTFFIFGASIHVIYMDMFAYVSEFCIKKLPLFGNNNNNNNMRLKACLTKLWNISTILLLFALAPYMMIIILLRYFNICYGDLALHSHSENDCPAHIGVGFALNMYGITHALIALKMLKFPEAYPIIYFENRALFIGGFLLSTFTIAGRPGSHWPWHGYSVQDNQHIGLYFILMFLPFVGMLAIWTKVRKNTFNLPAGFAASLIGLLLVLHDPNSHGLHKQIHVLSGTSWIVMVIFRIGNRHLEVGYFSPLAGTLFATVTNASQISRNLDASMDYLAIFFMACMYVGFLNSYLYLMVFLIRFLRGEKVDYDVADNNNNNNTSGYGHLSLQSMDSEDLDHFVDDVDGGDEDDGDVEIEMVNGDVRSNV